MKKPKFLEKLRAILDDPANYDVIRWINVERFVVVDAETLASMVLPRYFKHSSFSSFIRQLYAYGYHRQTNADGTVEFYLVPTDEGVPPEPLTERKKTAAQHQLEKLRKQVEELKAENQSLSDANEKLSLQLRLQSPPDLDPVMPPASSSFFLPARVTLTSSVEAPFEDFFYPADQGMMGFPSYSVTLDQSPTAAGSSGFPTLNRVPSLEDCKLKPQLPLTPASAESFLMDVDSQPLDLQSDGSFFNQSW